ncbi:MAG: hypothetical protein KFKLKKLM_00257 [Flavobacteriales bacterium]|nr:hypothetical protein [Flavobacteriales bacterium]
MNKNIIKKNEFGASPSFGGVGEALVFLFLVFSSLAFAQQQNLPLTREFNLVNNKGFNDFNASTHTAFQPIIQSQIRTTDELNWLSDSEKKYFLTYVTKADKKPKSFGGWLNQSFFHQHFIVVDTGNFYLTIDPMINLEFGEDLEDKSAKKEKIYTNTRGALVKGNIGSKFSFQTAFYENQAFTPNYISNFVNETGVMPGQGRVKRFKKTGYDFAYSSAYISYSPSKHFNFQLGNDKHFIGDGYRSLLLSDVATNYPYLKATVLFAKDKLQFTKLHADLTNLERREKGSVPEALFKRKSMSTHYVNWLATKWLNIGLFENTIWQTEDSTGTLPFNFSQLNPIPVLNGFSKNANSIIGLNTKIKLPFKLVIYNQLVYNGNTNYIHSGFQEGIIFYGVKNLTVQGEFNTMGTYDPIYYKRNDNYQTNDHYNQPLAHPLGNNFNEVIGIINYKYKRYFTQVKINFADFINASTNEDAKLTTLQAHLGFLINPKNNLSFLIGATNRTEETTTFSNKTNYVYFSIQTSLRNLYTDF